MPAGPRVVQVCLFLVAAIALFGGTVQMVLGQPDTTPRLDNLHRFMAGVYFAMGVISLWVGLTVRQHSTLILLIAFAVLMAAVGRLFSMAVVGLPQPHTVWLLYLGSELVVPVAILWGYFASRGSATAGAAHA